ncbi:MAG: hypothetical protein II794_04860 [Oscillospiraceae bacterium]|nr:hypothetical protein [Oscillospiraceae bacterium]
MKKAISLLLALVLSLVPLMACPALAADDKEIPGIDYNRITVKAGQTKTPFFVTLKLGELSFLGSLSGMPELSVAEMNSIIRQVLAEKDLTADRVALVSQIAARAQKDAGLYWGDQVAAGLLSYLPFPGTPYSVADYYDAVVHESAASAAQSTAINVAKDAAKAAIEKGAAKAGRIGKISRAAQGASGFAAKHAGMAGFIENSIMVAKDWLGGNKRFDDYLALLEKNIAIVTDFYAACSRRALEAAEKNAGDSAWVIKFDRAVNYRTYHCTFWEASNNLMECTLTGQLRNSGRDITGAYSGTLTLELKSLDLSPAEQGLMNTSSIAPFKALLFSMGSYRLESETRNVKPSLKRTARGEITVYITETVGIVSPTLAGSLTSAEDKVEFAFGRTLVWRDNSMAAVGGEGITETVFSSSDPSSVTANTSSRVLLKGEVKTHRDSTEVFAQSPGTVFAPLEAEPVMTIEFR